MPTTDQWPQRLRSVLHVLYLIFNEGHAAGACPHVARADLTAEAIRLARMLHAALPDEPEVAGLLALMLLTDARRPARAGTHGELVPLAEQDRTRWDPDLITEGITLISAALPKQRAGYYQLQAAIAAIHDEAKTAADTDWPQSWPLPDVMQVTTCLSTLSSASTAPAPALFNRTECRAPPAADTARQPAAGDDRPNMIGLP